MMPEEYYLYDSGNGVQVRCLWLYTGVYTFNNVLSNLMYEFICQLNESEPKIILGCTHHKFQCHTMPILIVQPLV